MYIYIAISIQTSVFTKDWLVSLPICLLMYQHIDNIFNLYLQIRISQPSVQLVSLMLAFKDFHTAVRQNRIAPVLPSLLFQVWKIIPCHFYSLPLKSFQSLHSTKCCFLCYGLASYQFINKRQWTNSVSSFSWCQDILSSWLNAF